MADWQREPAYTSRPIEQESTRLPPQKLRHALLPWLPEIVGLFISLASVVAVVALLRTFEGQQVPEWHGVTFNFVIGALAQISHALIIGPLGAALGQLKWSWFWDESQPRRVIDFQTYDKAGRSAVGAFSAILTSRLRPATTIGALLVVATLGLDPFLQGIPTYPIKLMDTNGTATISIAKSFGNRVMSVAGADSEEQWDILSSTTKGAFYSGVFNTSSSATVAATCPTGNCTWQDYSSLGVCSACVDLSSSLTSEINPEGYDGTSMIWSLPNGMTADSGTAQMLVNTSFDTIKYGNLQDYALVDVSSLTWTSSMMDSPSEPAAFECILHFCVRKYHGLVAQGRFFETVLDSFPNVSTSTADAQAAIQPDGPQTSSPALHPNDTTIVYPDTLAENMILSAPGSNVKYEIDAPTFTLMRQWLQATLVGQIDSSADPGSGVSDMSQPLYDAFAGEPSAFMNNIADSLTAQMRSMTDGIANGTTQTAIVVVQPRWIWLIYPLVVLGLALTFLITTIVLSAMKGMPTWKSSIVPSMVYSLDEATASAISAHGPRLRSLEKEAGRHLAALSRGDGQWTLIGTRYEDRSAGSERMMAKSQRNFYLGRE